MYSRPPALIEFINEHDILIVEFTPELDRSPAAAYEVELKAAVQRLLADPMRRYAVVDLGRTRAFSSALVGYLVGIWKITKRRGGAMAACGLSPRGKSVLEGAHLNKLWPIVADRDEALRTVIAARKLELDRNVEASPDSFSTSGSSVSIPVLGEACHYADSMSAAGL